MNQNVEKRLNDIEIGLNLMDCVYGAHYPQERYLLALVKAQREALEKISEYKAFNGDTWASETALSALNFDPSEVSE